jgi:hypothetical protein
LFDKHELVYLGRAPNRKNHNIRKLLLLHQDGALGACTMKCYALHVGNYSTVGCAGD